MKKKKRIKQKQYGYDTIVAASERREEVQPANGHDDTVRRLTEQHLISRPSSSHSTYLKTHSIHASTTVSM